MAQSDITLTSEDFLKRYPIIDCQLQPSSVSPILNSSYKAIISMDRGFSEKSEKQFTRFDVSKILQSDKEESSFQKSKTKVLPKESLCTNGTSNHHSDSKGQFKSESEEQQFPSYTAMIAQAILSTLEKKLTLGGIYEFIELRYPGLEKRVKGWRNCVRHNLSLNECFIKLGRSETGRGNDWAVHPSYLESFLRGEYRKRRACAKQRYDLVYIGGAYGYATTDQLMQWASRYQYMQYMKNMNVPCNTENEKVDSMVSYDSVKKQTERYHPYFQASRFQSLSCKCCCCADACRNQTGQKFSNDY